MTDRHTAVTECPPRKAVCGIRDILDRVGDTWSVLITIELRVNGARRFGELLRSVDGISQRMLTVTLRRLQRDGLVSRTVLDTSPPQVEYALTTMGRGLTDVLEQLADWSGENREAIDRARVEWDSVAR